MIVRVNGDQTEMIDGATIAQLLDRLNLNASHVAVEVNLELIPRERHLQFRLSAGDQLEIVTLVGGG
ncbi:MAG: sulfur carrier protein ThiS [Planctomycetaceae bacterium]|nr:sulfur carrier protein ThiS [Planctomycetaceae bacterium]